MPSIKIITLTKRTAGADLAAFHEQSLALLRSRVPPQGCLRIVASHTLPQGYRRGELIVDAVEEWSFDDVDDAHVFLQQQQRTPTLPALADPARTVHLIVKPHLAKDAAVPRGAVKNIEFVNRRPGMALESFRHYWKTVHGPLGAGIPSILRYEQYHCADAAYADGEPCFDGLAVTWFESTAAMRAGADTEVYRRTRADEVNFLPDGHLPFIITTEVLDTGPI